VFHLGDFEPSGAVEAGKPTTLGFTVVQPSGAVLTRYRRGAGPHTGVHVIAVRDDLGLIIHRHPPVAKDGTVRQELTFPTPGRYRILVDVYPNLAGPLRNFQLFHDVTVAGDAHPQPLPPFSPSVTVDGYRVALAGRPKLRALQPAFLSATVTDPAGKPAKVTPYYGALAHAIFFRAGSLDYFHTHVCGPNTPACTTTIGPSSAVTGTADAPGKLSVGVLLPEQGIWRLFVQFRSGGRIVTAPFTLRVR
jgi:hypothetical protein